jgi:hypothetical protein
MKTTKQSVLPADSINKGGVVATVHYEASIKGVIISRAQYEQMPEELKSQVAVIRQDAQEVTLEGEFPIIDDIVGWTVESEVPGSTGIELLFR